jgi:hypothetical protein
MGLRRRNSDIIVTAGFNSASATTCEAHLLRYGSSASTSRRSASTDQQLDPTFGCKGDAKTLVPNYISLGPGGPAGLPRRDGRRVSEQNGTIGRSAARACAPCIRYIQGYELGAKSINPNIKVVSTYVTNDFSNKAFNDPVTGKSFGQQFISQNKPDVLFQVAGKTGNGVIDAACDAGIYAIGVDVDQWLSYPNGQKCIITSAEKKLQMTVKTIEESPPAPPGQRQSLERGERWDQDLRLHDKAGLIPASLKQAEHGPRGREGQVAQDLRTVRRPRGSGRRRSATPTRRL